MTQGQIDALLREIYGYLKQKLPLSDEDWRDEVEPRIKAAAERISKMDGSN